MLTDLVLILLAYLLGSLSFGLLMARMYGGADLRRSGSGNIGATNVGCAYRRDSLRWIDEAHLP